MKKLMITVVLVFGLTMISSSCEKPKKSNGDEKQEVVEHDDQKKEVDLHDHSNELALTVYQCPMKCEGDKTYSEKGSCPVCNMDLKEVEPTEFIKPDQNGVE
jgi:transcription initiation factor IIE alpha subunit